MEATAGFQRAFGLKPDSVVKPGGPTERVLAMAVNTLDRDGEAGLADMRNRFGRRARAGLAFRPDPDDRLGGRWQDSRGRLLTAAQADAVAETNRPGRTGRASPSSTPRPAPAQAVPTSSSNEARPRPIMPVPAYRREVFGSEREREWTRWSEAVRGLPEMSASEQRAYAEIFAAEGGVRPDPRGSAASGITQATLDDLIRRGYVRGVRQGTPPRALPVEQRAEVYRGYFDSALREAGGSAALSRIPDGDAAAALADTLFRHGRRGGALILQGAINAVAPNTVAEDGAPGPKTLDAFNRLAAQPNSRARLLDAIAEARAASVRNGGQGNEQPRFDHFRFRKSGGSQSEE